MVMNTDESKKAGPDGSAFFVTRSPMFVALMAIPYLGDSFENQYPRPTL